jgi:ABC-type branched-subunit amino acid transport system substrate-binding protein
MLKTFITPLLRCFILFFITTLSLPLSAQDNLIIVGQAIDLSGPNAAVGRDYVAGITTFFDSINSHGGIHGKRVRYLVRDDQGNPANSAKLAAELIRRDKADFLIGGIGASTVDAVVATPAFQQSKISLFAPLSGVQKQYGGRVVYWRPSAEQEMQYIFSYFDKLGIRQVGIALQENSVNHDMYQYVVNEIQRRKMTLSGVVKITGNPTELSRESAKLAAGNPNIVITVADTVATGLFLKSFRRSAPKVFVAGPSLTNLDTVAELAGRSAGMDGVFTSSTESAWQKVGRTD